MSISLPLEVCAASLVMACWVADVRTRRIPNRLTGPVLVVGLLGHTLLFGWPGLLLSLAGAGVALACLLVPFALGGIGGGDVKMMVAVGALLGPGATAASLLLGMVLGGVIMLAHLARVSRLGATLASLSGMVFGAVATRSLAPLRLAPGRPDAVALPYSLPLGAATLAVLALRATTGG